MRIQGWEIRLHEYLQEAKGLPFQWGVTDCATWVSDWRKIATGKDASIAWRGKYKTERGAMLQIRRAGFQTMPDWVDSILGERLATPFLAQRGDIGLVQNALGIVSGRDICALSPDGVLAFPIDQMQMAWRVE